MESINKFRYDLIPINNGLIKHIKLLDGFKDEDIMILNSLKQTIIQKERSIQLGDQADSYIPPCMEQEIRYSEYILKFHEIFALLDIDWNKIRNNKDALYKEILDKLQSTGGLDYLPRERTPAGRVFDHANDSKLLVKIVQDPKYQSNRQIEIEENLFYISLVDGDEIDLKTEKLTQDEVKTIEKEVEVEVQVQEEVKADQKEDEQKDEDTQDTTQDESSQQDPENSGKKGKKKKKQKKQAAPTTKKEIRKELVEVKETKVLREYQQLYIKQKFIDISLSSKGKAQLYFHAHVWLSLIISLYKVQSQYKKDEKTFFDEVLHQNKEVTRIYGLAQILVKVAINLDKFNFDEETYLRMVEDFSGRKDKKVNNILSEIQRSLFVAQILGNQQSLHLLEKLLIQLLGHSDIVVRDQTVILLNMLYDDLDWQIQQAFKPTIRCVGQHFNISLIVDVDLKKNPNSQLFLGLSAPYPVEGHNDQILSWHKIHQRNVNFYNFQLKQIVSQKDNQTEININFGKFWKCGFYDWRIVIITEQGRLQPLNLIGIPPPTFPIFRGNQFQTYEDDFPVIPLAQGRYIVHAKGLRDQQFHEVQIDYQNAEVDYKQGVFLKRGNFQQVAQAIPKYKKQGINCLYLMGVLERDNYPQVSKLSPMMKDELQYRQPDAAPLAVTDRKVCNQMHGGKKDFQELMTQAKSNKMKIITDSVARISSSRSNRKYRDLFLHYLDESGKKNICYGTDGQSVNYYDSATLNYRKVESWDLLIDEIIEFSKEHQIDGIHFDNAQAWPQILEVDIEEMNRKDTDGEYAYTPMELLNGEVVLRNENHGYWNTNLMEVYANPFWIKLAKRIYQEFPNFILIGECWGGYMFENRQLILSRSGIVPRMFKLPQILAGIFGKKLQKDGTVSKSNQDETVVNLKKWYYDTHQFLPPGSIVLQSSSSHIWPYPAFLYEKGSWAAVDILFFMPDIPITFMNEIEGEVFRLGMTQLFQHEQKSEKSSPFKRNNSQIMMALKSEQIEESEEKKQKSKDDNLNIEQKRGIPNVRSGSKMAAIIQDTKNQDIKQKEERFKFDLGPQLGFDLRKIDTHYQHRRKLRKEKMVLRYGQLVPLVAKHQDGWHKKVVAFARHSLMETAIIVTNLGGNPVQFYVDLEELKDLYMKSNQENSIIIKQDWLRDDVKPEYFFLKEFLNMKNTQTLDAYRSQIYSISICNDNTFALKKTLLQSIERTKEKLSKQQNIENDQISILYSDILERNYQDSEAFANIIGSLQESFLNEIGLTFYDLFINNEKLHRNNGLLASRMLALCHRIDESSDPKKQTALTKACQSIIQGNKLGPIIFCTPELGRWSTVGGLGVMVDELSYGLAQMGQDVYVISPYYDRNRKGETDYLDRDPAGFKYIDNINAKVEQGFVIGVHEGVVNKVKLAFLHNATIFPHPYPDSGCADTVRAISVFAKGCLEFCCVRGLLPSICVTNDWFTGLIPAYAKEGHFGQAFKGTTFIHICHNLEPSYEGRVYPSPHDGACGHIHGLPDHYLIDPVWAQKVINPSRCAIIASDQWSTVSPSYKEDLLNSSPLSPLLKQKPNPFAFPNGIPIKERIKRLDSVAKDHLTAKEMIQQKYFNYQQLDDDVPVFAFVGRITQQKGVHLILDAAEQLIQKSNYKINIIVGGPANMREAYSSHQAQKMYGLAQKYPNCFWAKPHEFFMDGALINRGADFGLMPSIFEPGGIVQHEFFVGGTPVIAFKTGGLKDSVFEFLWQSEEGNGYCFENHSPQDFLFACQRAIGTYQNKDKYLKLRDNAFKSCMDGEKVSRAWLQEFYRLRNKKYIDDKVVSECLKTIKVWSPQLYKPKQSFEEIFGISGRIQQSQQLEDIDHGAESENQNDGIDEELKKVKSEFENPKATDKIPCPFTYQNQGPKYNQVQICGSFDNWAVKHNMNFDSYSSQWYTTLHLKKGKHYYKYILNGNQWVVNDKDQREKDPQNNINNIINL